VDTCLLAASYPEWFRYGRGVANYLAVPDLPTDAKATQFDLPGGLIMNGNLASVQPITNWRDESFRAAVAEDVTHAWYRGEGAQTPWKGETDPNYTDFHEDGKYTWVKAPRYNGSPIQVGPLANVLVGYASGHPLTRKWTDTAFKTISSVHGFKMTPDDLQSTMGRYLARGIRSAMLSDLALQHWQLLTDNILKGDDTTYNPPQFPSHECEGVGMHEAPRGALSHWVIIDKGAFSITKPSCRPPGMPVRVTRKAFPDPMRLRSLRIQWWTRRNRWKCSVPYTPSIRAWHARVTRSMRAAARSRG